LSGSPTVVVNGAEASIEGWAGRRLLDFLRGGLGLTGAKEGCGEGECGACTVLLDDEPVCSCLLLTDLAVGRRVTTVEGVDDDVRDAVAGGIQDEGGVQCGFCTPGFVVMAQWLARTGTGGEALSKVLEGNLCRCTGYVQLEGVLGGLVSGRNDRADDLAH
jgi:carbon-monoxide dehydrogenase small subunit